MSDKYLVTIQATILKQIEVDAKDEDEAEELAHMQFDVVYNGTPEKYEQDTLGIAKMEAEYQCAICGQALSFERWEEDDPPEFDSCVTVETPLKAGHVCDPCHRKMPCYETCR